MRIARALNEAAQGRASRPSPIARFRRNRDGATAVEFGFVAFPFILAVLATMEIAMIMWQSEVLQNGVARASRKIYTGEIQLAGGSMTEVRTAICAEVSPFINCTAGKLDIDVRPGSNPPNPVSAGNTYDASSFNYVKVDAKTIGSLTASFKYTGFFPALTGGRLADGDRAIMSTASFMAEPYN